MKKIITLIFSIITVVALAQDVKISAMPTATDLTGTTFIPIIQNGLNKKAPPSLFTGSILSVSGTANRITSIGSTTPVIDIAATYVGQTSITTLGTIGTGTWQGTPITSVYIGTLPYIPLGGSATLTANVIVSGNSGTYDMKFGSGVAGTEVNNFTVKAASSITLFNTTGTSLTINSGTISLTSVSQFSVGALGINVVLPSVTPIVGQALTASNTSGQLQWSTVGGTPGGSTTQLQYNNAGAFGGMSAVTYNNGTGVTTYTTPPVVPTPVGVNDAVPKNYVDGLTLGPFSTTLAGYTTASGGTGKYLKPDNTWAALPATDGDVVVSTGTSLTTYGFHLDPTFTTQGRVTNGIWNATIITTPYGGTGFGSYAVGDILYASTTTALSKLAIGTNTYVLTSNGTTPTWAASASLGWPLTGTGTFTGAVTIDQTTTSGNILKFLTPTLGVTPINGKGLWIANLTAAAAGAQQISGSVVWEGQGWATTPVASQSVKFIADVLPVQGAANPTATWRLSSSINGGSNTAFINATMGTALNQTSIILGVSGTSQLLLADAQWYNNVASNSGVYDFFTGGSRIAQFDNQSIRVGNTTATLAKLYVLQPALTTSGGLPALRIDGGASTNLTASAEVLFANFNSSASVQYATGAQSILRNILVQAPTIAFVGASTVTNNATFTIGGAPIAGTNTTQTNTHGLLIQAGAVSSAGASYGLTSNAQTGGTANYSAQFLGGNVGIGLSAPVSTLDVSGSFGVQLSSTSVDITLDATYHTVLVSASGANRVITLPASSGATRRIYRIKKTDATANTVTIDGNASETIDGALTKVVNTQYSGYAIQSDGSNWSVIATF